MVPPLRLIRPEYLFSKKRRKILSEWKCIFKILEQEDSDKSIWCRECSVTHEDLNRILQTSPLLLNRSSSTRKNRSKRPGQQHITTVLRDFRRKKRDLHSSMSAASQSLSGRWLEDTQGSVGRARILMQDLFTDPSLHNPARRRIS